MWLSFSTDSCSQKNDTTVRYVWESPEEQELEFGLTSKVNVRYGLLPVKSKVSFPVLNIPAELEDYIKPRQNIDSDKPEIVEKATEIARGEDDLFIVVFA